MMDPKTIERGFLERYRDRIVTIDSHTQGETTRLLIGGVGSLPGESIAEKRDFFRERHDSLRKLLTREPRGHRDIVAAVLTEPVSRQGDFGLFYMDARRYPHLCGHATIGAVVTLLKTGALSAGEGDATITVDTPSGPLRATARTRNGEVESVAIDMVPSFVFETDCQIELEGHGDLRVDLVCVGGFFAMVSARDLGLSLEPANAGRLISLGMEIIRAANRKFNVHHPERPEVNSVDVTEFHEEDPRTGHGRGVVVYGESHMDRSPCGTGTTAKMTLLHHQGKLKPGQAYINASPLGTTFEGRILAETDIGPFRGIVGQVRGNAQIMGFHQFVLDGSDPFPEGFLL